MTETVSSVELESAEGVQDWRVLANGVDAWFVAPSFSDGAALVAAVAHAGLAGTGRQDAQPAPVLIEWRVRRNGVRVTLRPTSPGLPISVVGTAREISRLAAAAGLRADPSVLSDVQLAIDVVDAAAVVPFWQAALGYEQVGDDDLVDPLRRNPPVWIQGSDAPRPLRNRIHVDVSRTAFAVEETRRALVEASASEAFGGPFGVCLADGEGNEIDVVPPSGDWDERPELSDWVLMFGAMTHYPVESDQVAAELAVHAAAIADAAQVELLIDLRPHGVTFDSAKDGWEMDERFADMAAQLQAAARGRGLVADPEPLRFVQIGIDAVDIDRVRDFWRAVLGYVDDPRRALGVTDIVDPLRWGPPVFFQDLDGDAARRAQRNRTHIDLFVPRDRSEARIAAALAAGGHLVRDSEAPYWVTIADPEGNEVDVAVITGRESVWGTEG
ncbi:VOC family protein [Pseudactinotalea suaedae]|uniref:VOC family protein n=1 Tax=Pseudactinotalea suaedae TaxID=1524924 RepID=UPI0012E2A8C4|nr:VOC family protein [Pseudactinotalea suaedae]